MSEIKYMSEFDMKVKEFEKKIRELNMFKESIVECEKCGALTFVNLTNFIGKVVDTRPDPKSPKYFHLHEDYVRKQYACKRCQKKIKKKKEAKENKVENNEG